MDISNNFLNELIEFCYTSKAQIIKHNESILKEMNFLESTYAQVSINLMKNGEEIIHHTLIQKQVGQKDLFDKKLFFVYFILLKEFDSYLKVKPNFDFIAKCVFLKDNYCVLEDPFKKGYKLVQNWNMNHAKIVLKFLAEWHSMSLALENIKNYTFFKDYSVCLQEPLFINNSIEGKWNSNDVVLTTLKVLDLLVDDVLQLESQLFKKQLSEYLHEALEILNYKKYENHVKVCCHGSLNKTSVLFLDNENTPEKCKLVNFQMMRYAAPLFDVLYLINFNMDVETRSKSKNELIKYYLNLLENELKGKYGIHLFNILTEKEIEETINVYNKLTKFFKVIFDINEILKLNKFNNEDKSFESNVKLKQKDITKKIFELKFLLDQPLIEFDEICTIIKNKIGTEEYQLEDFRTERLAFGKGFLGDHYFLKAKILLGGDEKMLSFFMKILPTNEGLKTLVVNNNSFYKESRFFNTILPHFNDLSINIWQSYPKCYLATERRVIFEDLSEQGFTSITSRNPLNLDVVKIILSNLAKMHASGFIFEELQRKKSDKWRLTDLYPIELQECLFCEKPCMYDYMKASDAGIKTLLKVFNQELADVNIQELEKWIMKYTKNIFEWSKPSKKFRNTVCHGDLWHNNFLVKLKEEKVVDCRFVDFQSYRYNSPATDFLTFIYWCTNREFRAENDVTGFYHKELKNCLSKYNIDINDIFTYDEFLESVEECRPYCTILSILWSQVGKQTLDELRSISEQEWDKFLYEDRSDIILRVCAQDPVYKEIMRNGILDFKDLYLKSVSDK